MERRQITAATVRIVQYNVLSSSLSQASYFYACAEKHCSSKHRIELLEKKLEIETTKNSIVCLQEVSLAWTGRLHTFFVQRGYTLIASNYGHRGNGYMGCGIAFPNTVYSLEQTDIATLADTKPGGWFAPGGSNVDKTNRNVIITPGEQAVSSLVLVGKRFKALFHGVASLVPALLRMLPVIGRMNFLLVPPPPRFPRAEEEDPWSTAKSRFNTMITIRLRPTSLSNKQDCFLVSTYHMPCIFMVPAVMSIHSALALQRIQMLSEGKYPYVFAGDFNFKPTSPQYSLYTTGVLPETVVDPSDTEIHGKPAIPSSPAFVGDKWSISSLPYGPVKSAYREVQGREPEWTNFALTGEATKPFKDTLDYIFYGSKLSGPSLTMKPVQVLDVSEMCKSIPESCKSLPNATEPSDHLLLAAEFHLMKDEL